MQYIENKPKEDQMSVILDLGMTSSEVGKSASTIRVQKKQKKDKKKQINKKSNNNS